MTGLFTAYSLQTGIVLTLLMAVYIVGVRSLRRPLLQRCVLVAIMALSLLSPLWLLLYSALTSAGAATVEVGMPMLIVESPSTAGGNHSSVFNLLPLLKWIIAIGAAVVTLHSIPGWIKLWRTIRRARKMRFGRYVIALTDNPEGGIFSWGKWIVCPQSELHTYCRMILSHERAHLNAMHWLDMLAAQILLIVNWWNPAAWILLNCLRDSHEFAADKAVIRSGADKVRYASMLIEKAVGKPLQIFANSLNHSQIKKRLTMMKNQKQSGWRLAGVAAIVPALAVAVAFAGSPTVKGFIQRIDPPVQELSDYKITEKSSDRLIEKIESRSEGESMEKFADVPAEALQADDQQAETQQSKEAQAEKAQPKYIVDGKPLNGSLTDIDPAKVAEIKVMKNPDGSAAIYVTTTDTPEGKKVKESRGEYKLPEYPGGSAGLAAAVQKAIVYPEEAKKAGIGGRAVVELVINSEGNVEKTKLMKGTGNEQLDAEALRVCNTLNGWIVAMKKGETTTFVLPVNFKAE